MQSPLFPVRRRQLSRLFSTGVIKAIWKKKVRAGMRKHPIVDAIDHYDYQLTIGEQAERLSKSLLSGSYYPSEPKRILSEKSRGLCRQLVIPSVDDSIVLQCLSDALYQDIRGKEPTNKAFFEPEDHSFRTSGSIFHTPGYGSFKSWLDFQSELLRFSRTYPYIIITDIANYYDCIGYDHLRNIIADLDISVTEATLDMLIYVLNGMLWKPDYMPRVERGLPQVNTDAPRILAHCFLYELDRLLESRCSGDFARYMDDIDIGANSIAEAKSILRDMDLSLHTRQVRLNSGKTKILSQLDAAKHYRTRDNRFLNAVERHIERKMKAGVSLARERNHLATGLKTAYNDGRFDSGNGEKILKRIIKIASKIGADIDNALILDAITKRPGVRENVFKLVAQLPAPTGRIYAIHQLLTSNSLVDDTSFVNLATYITETPVVSIPEMLAAVALVNDYPIETTFQLYGKIYLASKYFSDLKLLELLTSTKERWEADFWLSRLVGACYPRFINTSLMPTFRMLARSNGSTASIETFDFHHDLATDPAHFDKVFDYMKAGNPSKRIGTTHVRFLMMASALSNKTASDTKKKNLISSTERAWSDSFYRTIASITYGSPMPAAPTTPFPCP